jgi:putative MATE family efflux protein
VGLPSGILDGPIRAAVFWLALPVLGEQLLNACVTWNDAILAGRISAVATGAIGLAGYVGWLMTMLFGLVSIGATAIVARAVGARDPREAGQTANQSFVLAVIVGLASTAFVYVVAPSFVRLQNMHGEAATIAITYMRIDGLGFAGAAVSFALAACLRGAGDTRTPMVILGAVNVLNLGISWMLTFGLGPIPGIGVNGIAWGTAIARWLGAFWVLGMLIRGRRGLRLHLGEMRPDRDLIYRILRIGVPAAADGALIFTGHFIYMTIVNRIPTELPREVLYAAHIVGVRLESLSYLPTTAWALAASTLVGQNLGAGNPVRARRCAHEAVLQAALLLVGSGLLYYLGAPVLYRLLSNDPLVWTCGVPVLMWLAPFQLAMAPIGVYVGALRGAGETRVPMVISAIGLGLIRIPVSAFCGIYLARGLLGVWTGMYADLTLRAILTALYFRVGRWQRVKV